MKSRPIFIKKQYLHILFSAIIDFVVFLIIGPYLISARDDLHVLFGLFLCLISVIYSLHSIYKFLKEIVFNVRESENK